VVTHHDESELGCTERQDDDPRRIEIVLPRARPIVWLGIKVYLMVVGVLLARMAVMAVMAVALMAVALIAATR
jgi:hypothetical protein